MARQSLDDILGDANDEGLLADVKPRAPTGSTEDNRARQQFEEINVFIDRHGRNPGVTAKPSVSEKSLQIRLQGMLANPDAARHMLPHDRHGLLAKAAAAPKIECLDDILDLDDDILETPDDHIFTYRHAPAPKAKPDEIAERERCADFADFKSLFDGCAAEIRTGRRKTLPFANEQEIGIGQFFILKGVLAYVAEINDPYIRNGKKNARLRLIFDNGTESKHLLRSLARELYKDPDGRRVTTPDAGPLFTGPSLSDVPITGLIYVVKSLSTNPEISKLDGNLFKLGVTTSSVEARIQGARDQPTYLLAPVHPVMTYSLFGMDPVKAENLLHRFFAEARLNIEIMDRFGKPFKPREWFLVPLDQITRAVEMLAEGSIILHRYDAKACAVVPTEQG
jgi:hypothetical protein